MTDPARRNTLNQPPVTAENVRDGKVFKPGKDIALPSGKVGGGEEPDVSGSKIPPENLDTSDGGATRFGSGPQPAWNPKGAEPT